MGKYEFVVDLDNPRSTHTRLINLVGQKKDVLDIGCASGYLGEALQNYRDCVVTGLDLCEEFVARAKKIYKDAFVVNLESDDLKETLSGQMFDVALLADVLEHTKDPKAALLKILPHIKESVVISVPNIAHKAVIAELIHGQFKYREQGLLDNTHLHFFTLKSITSLLNEVGLVIDEIQTTQICAEDTELEFSKGSLPPEIEEYLDQQSTSSDYQYVIKASKPEALSPGIYATYTSKAKELEELQSRHTQATSQVEHQINEIHSLKTDLKKLSSDTAELRKGNLWYQNKLKELNSVFYSKKMFEQLEEKQTLADLCAEQRKEVSDLREQISLLERKLPAKRSLLSRVMQHGALEPIRLKRSKSIRNRNYGTTSLYPKIAIFSLSFNSSKWFEGYFDAISKIDYPIEQLEVFILDNGSSDNSWKELQKYNPLATLKHSKKNLGFSGGNNRLLEILPDGFDYVFLLNIDTQISPQCLKKLAEVAYKDPKAGIIEARQTPREHPKEYDELTLETPWCSGGGSLIKIEAIHRAGFFDDRFFLYCEDVDLSWRIWQAGYRCIYNPDATYQHFTEDLDEKKDLSIQRFYSIRNSFYMRYKYASISEIKAHFSFLNSLIKADPDPSLLKKAKRSALLNAPKFILDRLKIKTLLPCEKVYFSGFEFEKRRNLRKAI